MHTHKKKAEIKRNKRESKNFEVPKQKWESIKRERKKKSDSKR